jgi:hypothetical protein
LLGRQTSSSARAPAAHASASTTLIHRVDRVTMTHPPSGVLPPA